MNPQGCPEEGLLSSSPEPSRRKGSVRAAERTGSIGQVEAREENTVAEGTV